MERVFVFTVWDEGEATDYATVLPPEVFSKAGARGEAIIGSLPHGEGGADGVITPEGFVPNEEFHRLLQETVAEHAPTFEGCRAAAEQIGNGSVYVIDRRTPTPEGPVPPEDIIGGFKVADGRVVPGSYFGNPNHRLLTERGFFHLEDGLHQRLVAELVERANQGR
jgi:hypothetical protein